MTDPVVLRELSKAAGVELEPVMETMELGHANVQVDFSAYDRSKGDAETMRAVTRDLTRGKFTDAPHCSKGSRVREEGEIEKGMEKALMPWQYVHLYNGRLFLATDGIQSRLLPMGMRCYDLGYNRDGWRRDSSSDW